MLFEVGYKQKKKKAKMPKIPTKRRRVNLMPNLTNKYLHSGRFLTKSSTFPQQQSFQQSQSYSMTNHANEIKCKDQILAPSVAIGTVIIGNVAYIEPTVAGLGLATGYTCINTLSQGSQISQRIGNKVVIKSLRVKGTILPSETADSTDYGMVRVAVVYDKQTNGTAPAATEIFASIDSAGAFTTQFQAPLKITNKKRFTVLRDENFVINGINDSAHKIDWYIKRKMPVEYNSTATPPTVANITTGAIYLVVFCNGGTFTHVPQIQDFQIRMRYFD